MTFGNGAIQNATFDSRQRPLRLVSGPLDITYGYDAVGNVTNINDVRDAFDSEFDYDKLDRLTSTNVDFFGARSFTYDAAGNRLTKTDGVGANVYSYDPPTQRLINSTDISMSGPFSYDPVGNMTAGSGATYEFTPLNLMKKATISGTVFSYEYDSDNMRVVKRTPADVLYYIHGIGSQLLAEYRETPGGPAIVREYVYLGTKMIASATSDEAPTAGGMITDISVAPQSAVAGTSVSLTVTGGTQACSKVELSFGDGTITPYTIASPYQLPLVVSHTYAAAGLYTVVAKGQNGASGPCSGTVSTPLEVTSGNVVDNGDFSQVDGSGLPIGWGIYTQGGSGYWNASSGVFNFYRTEGMSQAVTLQYTGLALPTAAPLELTFRMGNSDTVRKRLSVMVHTPGFDDLALCTFWLDPNQPLKNYAMLTHTTKAWTDATASFYAADVNASGSTGAYQLDDVSLTYRPASSSARTVCDDPNRPLGGEPGIEAGGNALLNPNFENGTNPEPWLLAGTSLRSQISNTTLEFHKGTTGTAPLISQATSWTAVQDQRFGATFELGNTSSTRQRVTMQLQDSSGTDFTNCVFWLAPGAPKELYAITTYASIPWSAGMKISVTPATVGAPSTHEWLQLDHVSFFKTVSLTLGTECFEPGSFTVEPSSPSPLNHVDPISFVASTTPGPFEADVDLDHYNRHNNSTGEKADGIVSTVAVALAVGVGGSASGTVSSSPTGLNCGGRSVTCTGWFPENTSVTLTATPDAGQVFESWTGECSGTGDCVVTLIGSKSVGAVFGTPSVTAYYHLDLLGSVRAVTGTTAQTVIKRHDYFVFGEDPAPMTGDPIRFTGKELDAETAFQYFGARYYAMTVGRFTSVDPLARSATTTLPQTWNRYSYTMNNPLRYIDPNGACSAPAGIAPGQVGICIGSFIAAKGVGLFRMGDGDNRGPIGNDAKATFRVQVQMVVTPGVALDSKNAQTQTGRSTALWGLVGSDGVGASSISSTVDGKGNTSINVRTVGMNGLFHLPGAPTDAIDTNIALTVTKDGKVGVEGGQRDGFPSLEIYAYDSNGNVRMILVLPEGKESALAKPMEQLIPKVPPK